MDNRCTLEARECKEHCSKCGWNIKEIKMRKQLLDANRMTVCKDGLKRLIIKREEYEE